MKNYSTWLALIQLLTFFSGQWVALFMNISEHDAVVRLRVEVLAPDWQLSSNRITYLQGAFATLGSVLCHRPHCLAVLGMARNVLVYIAKRPANMGKAMDFLKEAMAHIISMYEEDKPTEVGDKQHFLPIRKRYEVLRLGLNSRYNSAG